MPSVFPSIRLFSNEKNGCTSTQTSVLMFWDCISWTGIRNSTREALRSSLYSPRDWVRQMLRLLLHPLNPSRLWLQLFPWRFHSFSCTHPCTSPVNHPPHPACLATCLLPFESRTTTCWVMLPHWWGPTIFFTFWEKAAYGKSLASPREGFAHTWPDFKMWLFWKRKFING